MPGTPSVSTSLPGPFVSPDRVPIWKSVGMFMEVLLIIWNCLDDRHTTQRTEFRHDERYGERSECELSSGRVCKLEELEPARGTRDCAPTDGCRICGRDLCLTIETAGAMSGWCMRQIGTVAVIWRSCEDCGTPAPAVEVASQSWELRARFCRVEGPYGRERLKFENAPLFSRLRAKRLQDPSDC